LDLADGGKYNGTMARACTQCVHDAQGCFEARQAKLMRGNLHLGISCSDLPWVSSHCAQGAEPMDERSNVGRMAGLERAACMERAVSAASNDRCRAVDPWRSHACISEMVRELFARQGS